MNKTQKTSCRLVLALAVLALATWALAQQPATQPANEAAAAKTHRIELSGDGFHYDDVKGLLIITGNVLIEDKAEQVVLKADKVEYDRKSDKAVATGNLLFTTPESHGTGLTAQVDFKQRKLALVDKCDLTIKPDLKPRADESEEQRKEREKFNQDVQLLCDRIDYDYKTQIADATGNFRLVQGKRTGTATRGIYNRKQDEIKLEGEVKLTDEKGQMIEAPSLVVNPTEQWLKAEQRFKMTIFVEEEEETTEPPASTEPTPAAPSEGSSEPPAGS